MCSRCSLKTSSWFTSKNHIKLCLHWWYYQDIPCDIAGIIAPYLLTLANRNDPISVAMPKVTKASTIVAVGCRCRQHYRLKINTNVNYLLPMMPIWKYFCFAKWFDAMCKCIFKSHKNWGKSGITKCFKNGEKFKF